MPATRPDITERQPALFDNCGMDIDFSHWGPGFDAYMAEFAGRFPRVEPRRRAIFYVRGLLSELERKNGWTLAEGAGDKTPDGMQRLLNASPWDEGGVRDDLREIITNAIGDKERGILVVDETGFLKKGKKSAGVARMYTGTAGKTENCQIGVFLAYTSPGGGHALIDRELYLPAAWTNDPDRSSAAGIPDDVQFATKYQLAQRMIERTRAAGTPFTWITADEVYGQAEPLRDYLESEKISYVLAVRRTEKVALTPDSSSTAETVVGAPETQWQRISAGEGTKGPRLSDWSLIQIPSSMNRPGHRYILSRRSIDDPTDLAYYFCYSERPATMQELVQVAASRWTVEECFQTGKNEAGLDHYQVRDYTAWYRHMTLSMIALAFLTIVKGAEEKRGSSTRTTASSHSPATKYDDYSTGFSGP
jgi:SRSO17 transposase